MTLNYKSNMKGLKISVLAILFFVGFGINYVSASHIVGGELNYRCLGKRTFEITLVIYRDCEFGDPRAYFDDPAWIGIYDGRGNLQNSEGIAGAFQLPAPTVTDTLAESINSVCFEQGDPVCVEVGVYIDTVQLTEDPNGYILTYQRCCRNETILNINDPDQTGSNYWCYIPPSAFVEPGERCNSNPKFNEWPPVFICQGQNLDFDHSATDFDGDELVYKLCQPSTALSAEDPKINSVFEFDEPTGLPVPFDLVSYAAGYDVDNMLGGTDDEKLKIDPATGRLTATPPTIGQFVIGVCVEEWRDGEKLSETRRDFQFNVRACGDPPEAVFEAPNPSCESLEVTFTNTGVGNFWGWDFGDGTTSTDQSPTHTFPAPGFYDVRLTAYIDSSCVDNMTQRIYVHNIIAADLLPDAFSKCDQGNTITANTQTDSTYQIDWSYDSGFDPIAGTGATFDLTDLDENATLYIRMQDGNGCEWIDEVDVDVELNVDFNSSNEDDCGTLTVEFGNTGDPGDITWDFGDGTTGNGISITHTYPESGTYTVTMHVVTQFCNGSISKEVTVISDDVIDLDGGGADEMTICEGDDVTLNEGGNPDFDYTWSPADLFDDPNAVTQTVTLNETTTIFVTVSKKGDPNCFYTDTITINVITIDGVNIQDVMNCEGGEVTLNEGGNPDLNYTWSPAELFAGQVNAVSPTINLMGTQTVTVVVENPELEGCTKTFEINVTIEDAFDYVLPEMVVQCGEGDVTIQGTDNEGDLIFTWLTDPVFVGNPLVTSFTRDGFVTVVISKEGSMCPDTQQVEVVIENVDLQIDIEGGNDVVHCPGDDVTLHLVGDIPTTATISWTPPAEGNGTSTTFPLTATNTIAATVTTVNGCEFSTSVEVKVSPYRAVVQGPFCVDMPGATQTYSVTEGATSYTWSSDPPANIDDPNSPTIEVNGINQTTTFKVVVVDEFGCVSEGEITTQFTNDCDGGGDPNCDKPIFVPNVFTPNGDGVNDFLTLAIANSTATLEIFIIYDRWGNEIFSSNSINNVWDGTKDGVKSPQDVYGYYARGLCDGATFIQRGNITLLR